MKKKIFLFLGSLILLFLPRLAVSDCTDLGRVPTWVVQGDDTIIYYRQNTPAAKVV
jgi:hypothetical protein